MKKRLIKIDNVVALPLSDDFLVKQKLTAGDIVNFDEAELAKILSKAQQEDLIADVLANLAGGFSDEE